MKYKYFKPIFIGLSCLLAVSAKADDLKQDRNKITIVQPDNSDAVKAYALTNNVTEGEAERRLKIMGNYNTIFAELNQKYGDSIAGIYFDNGKNFKLVVRTNKPGKPKKEIKNFANGLELPIEVIPNSPRNSQAISNIINNQFNRLSSNIKGLSAIGYDPVKDVLDIYIYEPNESTQQEILSDPKLQKISGLDTNIIFIKTPLSSNALKGGSPINQNMGMMQNLCTADSSATSIARYKVASKDSIFKTARLQGKLELKDNCLVIQQEGEPKPYLLALPISDDSSEWKIDLVGNQLLYKDKKYKLGEKLDLGGGFMEYSKLVVKPKGCENYGVWAGYILRSLSK